MQNQEYAVFIGIPCVDEYYNIINRWPVEGDKFAVKYQESTVGGMISNAACVMAGLGYKCYSFCGLYQDETLPVIFSELQKYHVEVSKITIKGAGRNTKCHIYRKEGERTIGVVLGDSQDFTLEDEQLEFLRNAKVVYTSLNNLSMFQNPLSLFKDLYEHGVKIVLDNEPSFKIPDWECYMPYCYLASFNEHAIAAFGEGASESEFRQKLLGLGVQVIAETFGSEGCCLITKDEEVTIPACKVKAIDTTGAGDTFNASLTYALVKEYSLTDAGKFASAAAGRAVTLLGGKGGITTEQTVQLFAEQHYNK